MLIHCTMDELTAVRDGEGSPGALRHLDNCQACRDELDRLHQRVAALKALPPARPPRDRWPLIRQQIQRDRRRRRWRTTGWISTAVAASLALTVATIRFAPVPAAASDARSDYQELLARTQALEGLLRRLEPEQRVLTGRTASAVGDIEDRLMVLDARVSRAQRIPVATEDLVRMLRLRVELMDALVNLHTTRNTYVGF